MSSFAPPDATRILTFVSHLRFPVLVGLDRWGLVPIRGHGGRDPGHSVLFRCWDARHWGRAVERTEHLLGELRSALRRYRPALVVLGIPVHESRLGRSLRERVTTFLRDLSIPYVIRRVESLWPILFGRPVRRVIQTLAKELAAIFPRLDPKRSPRRNHRLRWYALALALIELARRHPRQAMALLPRDVPALCFFIRRHELRLHPDL